jgi:hypothetical protein
METWVVNEGIVMGKVASGQGILQAFRFSHANYRSTNVRYSFIIRGGKIGPPVVAVKKGLTLIPLYNEDKDESLSKWIAKAQRFYVAEEMIF